jgi:hypothetical protein
MQKRTMQINLKKLVGAAAIAGALGTPAFVVDAGVANAATAPSMAGPVQTVRTFPADRGHGDCDCGDWGGWGGWDGGWRGDGDWHGGGWGWPWGWGWRR